MPSDAENKPDEIMVDDWATSVCAPDGRDFDAIKNLLREMVVFIRSQQQAVDAQMDVEP